MNATTPVNPSGHIDEVTGLLYIEGQLESAAAHDVVAHLEQCSPCRRLLDTLKRESLLLRAALIEQDELLPARLLAPRHAEGLSWGWLIALGMGAAGLYTFWNIFISPWIDSFEQSGFGGQFLFTWLIFNGAFWKGWNTMLQFIVLGSLGMLGAVLLFLLRRNLRRPPSHSAFLAGLFLAVLAWPQPAHAAEYVKTHGSYEVPEGRTVKSDLYVLATSVRIAGTVEGDLYCFCSSLDVDGRVAGDVISFSHVMRVTGKVDGSLRSFTQSLTIDGEVSRNILSFVASFETTPRSHVQGSATLFVGELQLDGPLGRDLIAFLGTAILNAPIGGDVRIRQSLEDDSRFGWHPDRGPVQVTSKADVKGAFRYRGPFKPVISPQAHLASAPELDLVEPVPAYRRPMSYWYNAMIWGMAFIVGLVVIAIAPRFLEDAAEEVGRIGAPLGIGLVTFFMVPITGVIACCTVVGLGVGVTLVFLWIFLAFFAQIVPAIWIGQATLGRGSGPWAIAGRLALGLLLIRIGALLPYVGGWIRMTAAVLGCGALALEIFRRFQPQVVPVRTAAPAA